MPTPQNLTLQAAINGGAPSSGGLTVAASATVLLSPVNPSGISKLLYEIYEWPLGWTGPASGWTYDSDGDRWYAYTAGAPAPVFTLPDITLWGKFMFRGTANDGRRDGKSAADLVDERTAAQVISTNGLYDTAFGETTQFEGRRQWMGAMKRALRHVDTAGGTINGAAGIGTIASPGILRGTVGTTNLKALHVGGFWTIADSGGGSFYWDAASTATDDGGTIIRPAAIAAPDPGRWKRIYNGPLFVDWFGAYGDSTTGLNGHDDRAAFQAAFDVAAAHGGSHVSLTAGKNYRVGKTAVADAPCLVTGASHGVSFGSSGNMASGLNGATVWFSDDPGNASYLALNSSSGFVCRDVKLIVKNSTWDYTRGVVQFGDGLTGDVGLARMERVNCSGPTRTAAITGVSAGTPLVVTAPAHGLANGIGNIVADVACATTANITLSGEQTIDGVLTSGSRVLVKAQTVDTQNGIYVSGAGAWARAADMAAGSHSAQVFTWVSAAKTGWICVNVAPLDVVGTDSVGFSHCPKYVSIVDVQPRACGANGNWRINVLSSSTFELLDSTPASAYTSGGTVSCPTVPRFMHLGNTVTCQVRDCAFQDVQIGVYGSGEGSSNANQIRNNQFLNVPNAAILNPAEAWILHGNCFETCTGIATDGSNGGGGVSAHGNWCGDGYDSTVWMRILTGNGWHIAGNLFGNSVTRAAVQLDGVQGFTIVGNDFLTSKAINFTASAGTSSGVFVAANVFGGTDADLVSGRGNCTRLNVYSQLTNTIDTFFAPSGIFSGIVWANGSGPVNPSAGMHIGGSFGTKPTAVSGAPGAAITWESATGGSFGTDSDHPILAYWPPQNETLGGHGFYAYDASFGTTHQKLMARIDPRGLKLYGGEYIECTSGALNLGSTQAGNASDGMPIQGDLANVTAVVFADSPFTLTTKMRIIEVDTTGGPVQLNFPAAAKKGQWIIVDAAGTFGASACTLHRSASETVNGVSADKVLSTNHGRWTVWSNGTNRFTSPADIGTQFLQVS